MKFAPDCIGPEATEAARELQPGEILMLENLRFHPEEEKNDMAFAASLASLADIYVNNGFGVSHRAHASVEGVAHYLPAVSGFLLEKKSSTSAMPSIIRSVLLPPSSAVLRWQIRSVSSAALLKSGYHPYWRRDGQYLPGCPRVRLGKIPCRKRKH